MAKQFTVSISEGQAAGPYNIYYDTVNASNYATLVSTSGNATSITLAELTGYGGVVVSVPDSASKIIIFNTDANCQNSYDLILPTSTPTPTPTAAPATSTPTPTPTSGGGSPATSTPTPTPTTAPATATPTPTPTSGGGAPATSTPTPTPTSGGGAPATSTPTPTAAGCYTYSIQNNSPVDNLTYRYRDCSGTLIEDNVVLADSGTPDFCAQPGSVTRQGGTTAWVLTQEATTCTVGSAATATPTPTPTTAPAEATATPTPVGCSGAMNHYVALGNAGTAAGACSDTLNDYFYLDTALLSTANCISYANPYSPAQADWYSDGEIARYWNGTTLGNAVLCSTPATATPTPTPAPTLYSVTLEYGTVDCTTVCNNYGSNLSGTFWLDEANFSIASKIYQSNNVNDPANAWFYTDGTECRAADGSGNLGSSSSC